MVASDVNIKTARIYLPSDEDSWMFIRFAGGPSSISGPQLKGC